MIETIFRATATATAAEQAADELREIIFDKAKKNSPA
jgi:hypothetical protein